MKTIKEIIKRSLAPLTRTCILLLAPCAFTSVWAAAGDTVTFANDGHSFKWAATDFADSNSYQITIPAGGSLSAGDYVRVKSFAFGRNSVNDAVNVARVTSVDFAGNTISSASYATDNKFPTIAAWKEKYSFGAVGSDNDLILKVGTTYTFGLLDSNGSTAAQRLGTYTTTDGAYSPVAQTVTDATTKRMQQEVVVTVLASAVTSEGGNWSSLSWSNAPADWTTAPVLVVVEDDCTITLDSNVSVDSVVFNIAAGKTLTLAGANTLTAASGIIVKGGTVIAPAAGTLSGTVKGNGTLVYTAAPSGLTLNDSSWKGVLWLKNVAIAGLVPGNVTSANSTLRLTGCTGYFNNNGTTATNPQSTEGTLDLQDDGSTKAFTVNNGWSDYGITVFGKLTGSGTLGCSTRDIKQRYVFKDATQFTGSINTERTDSAGAYYLRVILGDGASLDPRAGTIMVVSGATATVAAGQTWNAWAINVNGTLNVNNGSTIPAINTGSEGVVQITSAGTATISGVKDNAISTSLVMVGGNIAVVDTGITEVTIPAETGVTFFSMANGKLDLSGCTSLTTLKLNLGSGTTFDMANVILPASCTTALVDVGSARDVTGYTISNLGTATLGFSATETKEEYANGTFSISNVPSGATVTVTRANGTTATATVTDGTARLADYGTVRISGAATDLDLTCDDESIAFDYTSITGAGTNRDNAPVYTEDGVYARANVYTTGSGVGQFLVDNSAAMTLAVVGSMSPTANTIFLSLGGSNSNFNGLVLVRTANTDEVIIGYNVEGVVHKIAEMTVPNCATARHVYIITKEDEGANSIFTVYLDGIKWKTLTISKLTFVGGGIQVGADFHGGIRGNSQSEFDGASFIAIPNNESETGVLNAMRVYGRVITSAEIAAYTTTFPYVSPNGSSARTFTVANENWIDTTQDSEVWVNSAGGTAGTPLSGAALNVTANVATEVTVNLASETSYEALTVGGEATTFVPGTGGGDIKVTGMTLVGGTVVFKYGAVDVSGGPMTITEDGDVTFDYSAYDASAIYAETDVALTSDVDEDSSKVHLNVPVTPYRTYSLVYTSGHYAMRITPIFNSGNKAYYTGGFWSSAESGFEVVNSDGDDTIVFPGDTVVVDEANAAGGNVSEAYVDSSLPVNVSAITVDKNYTFQPGTSTAILGGTTVEVTEGNTLTFGATWLGLNLGAVTFNGLGSVMIYGTANGGATDAAAGTFAVSGAVNGTAAITIGTGRSVTVTSTGSIANAIALGGQGATLVVQSGATVTEPTSGDEDYVVLSSESEGTVTYYLGAKIMAGDDEVGYMDGTTAIITDTSATASIPGTATRATIASPSGVFTIVASQTQLTTPGFLTITVPYGSGNTQDITSAFTSQVVGGDASAAQLRMTFTGDNNATVRVGDEDIKVEPELAASAPMAVANTGAPTFAVKTIPGLWYVVKSGTSVDALTATADSAVQADSVGESLAGPAIGASEEVRYYKIAVGVTKAAAESANN